MMSEFEKSYSELNPEQKNAVDTIDGPVLVVAGPGTGKTQLLGMRVANILQKTDTDAASILCLTFTNKAATNMRDRLLKLAGPTARDVMVRTFHSFAAEIMSNYPDYFWNGARLVAAPDAAQLEIVESILGDLPLDNPLALKFAGQFTAVKDVQSGLKLAKEAGLTPEKLRAIINLNLAYIDQIEARLVDTLSPALNFKKLDDLQESINDLPDQGLNDTTVPLLSLPTVIRESLSYAIAQDKSSGKTTNVGKWKRRLVQNIEGQKGMFDERKRNAWWLALADTYELYRQALHGRGYYDYADMLVEVVTQLEQNAELRASVQERFLYVLIDEFQDTNAAQLRLSQLVANHESDAVSPNIMAVGDDDQSIYKFNGAELNNMLSFKRIYNGAQLFVLTENYRSSQAILDTAKREIELAHDRLVKREPDLNKTLRAANPPKNNGVIKHLIYPSRDHQLSQIARSIKSEYQSDNGSVAVLARGHDSLRQLASLLQKLDVPVRYEQSNNIFDQPIVMQIIRIAKAISAVQNGDEVSLNANLPSILRNPMWGIPASELWQLAAANFGRAHWLDSLTGSHNQTSQSIGHWLLWLANEADNQPISVIIEYIIGLRASEHLTSPLREYYLKQPLDTKYMNALSAIKLLQSLVSNFSRGEQKLLPDFIRFTDVMNENGQVIADESIFVTSSRAVELYTVHKAKGLEFDTVYIVDAVDKNWQPMSGGRKPPANLPLQPSGDDEDDYVRLMYVALTRAKRSIYVSSYHSDSEGKEVIASPLISSCIEDTDEIKLEGVGQSIEVLEETLRWPRLDNSDEKLILHDRLQAYSLSATHLLNFLDVSNGGPTHFLETNLLRLPEAKSARAAFGSAIHSTLEYAQKSSNLSRFDLAETINQYEDELLKQRLPSGEFNRYLVHGQNVLTNLFEGLKYKLTLGSLPEQTCRVLLPGNISLFGKLDRIDFNGKEHLDIIDYKTGKPLSSFETRDQTKAIKAWRHKTQLSFYTLLARNTPRFKHTLYIEGCMVYVEAESPRLLELRYAANAEELERLTRLIKSIWEHIITLNLPDITNYSPDIEGILAFEEDLISNKI